MQKILIFRLDWMQSEDKCHKCCFGQLYIDIFIIKGKEKNISGLYHLHVSGILNSLMWFNVW